MACPVYEFVRSNVVVEIFIFSVLLVRWSSFHLQRPIFPPHQRIRSVIYVTMRCNSALSASLSRSNCLYEFCKVSGSATCGQETVDCSTQPLRSDQSDLSLNEITQAISFIQLRRKTLYIETAWHSPCPNDTLQTCYHFTTYERNEIPVVWLPGTGTLDDWRSTQQYQKSEYFGLVWNSILERIWKLTKVISVEAVLWVHYMVYDNIIHSADVCT